MCKINIMNLVSLPSGTGSQDSHTLPHTKECIMSQISRTIRARDILRKKFKFNSRLLLTNELEMSSVLAKQKSLVDVPFLLRTNSKNTTVRELWRIWLLVFQTKCNCRLRFAALWCPLFYASVVRNTKPILNVYIHL